MHFKILGCKTLFETLIGLFKHNIACLCICSVLCISSLIVAINVVGLTSELEVQVASCRSNVHCAMTVRITWSRMHMNFIATNVQVKID